ncbi:MAG: 3,4-dihydroxy-2-butanone-4-phosphate synthase [Sphingomonadales bacterium]|nr:MAG: 3,4-dihydroxy-2-butanone-4-phosphate synthase [Sphingomonadales bacterium]
MITQTIDRIQSLLTSGDVTKAGLARDAGLHPNSLRLADRPDWNPTADTLRKLEAYLSGCDATTRVLSPIEDIIEDARNGRMVILVDDEDRENEGDLVVPAQMATPEVVNFMARYGRGLICLSMTRERVEELNLPLMTQHNGTRHQTAFTVSIEARDGVATGISAADRARTIQVAIDPGKGPEHIVTPGHVFPLMARDGGVLVRAGHTEAAVDLARLAGLTPAGVICEIMNDDGSMARLNDLVPFARRHGLKIGSIADLIAYRRRHDTLVASIAQAPFKSRFGGDWQARCYVNTAEYAEHLALIKGRLDVSKPVLVRMHAISLFPDFLGEDGPRCGQLQAAMTAIGEEGSGVIVLIRDTRPTRLSQSLEARSGATPAAEHETLRDYGIGAQILVDLGVKDMILLTNSSPHTVIGLEAYGLNIVEERRISL